MSKVTYAVRRYTIGPGETVDIVRDAGFITCLDATAAFKIRFDDGSASDFEAGLTYRPTTGFERVSLLNHNDETIVVRLGFGKGDIADARVTISAGNTLSVRELVADELDTPAPISVANGAVAALVAANDLRRELLVVSPVTAAGTVYIGGDAAAVAGQGLPLMPGQSLTLTTGAAVYARNDTGEAVALAVAAMGWSA